ncbi:MAG: class II aldolase/adducin family protein [Myxococcales bacterium]|nr:class II aldolase/adducin family protein [Myxococcales bacterium]
MATAPLHRLHHGEPTLGEARRQLLAIAHELHGRGWVANHDGNVTLRLPAGRLLATPTALSKRVLTEQDLIVVDAADQVVQGGRRAFSELKLHRAVYAARPDVMAVVHTHSPSAAGLAVAGVAVEPRMLAEAVVSLGAQVPLLPYAFPNAAEQIAALQVAAAAVDAVTLENHGVLAWGGDLEAAFLRAELVEHLATIQLRALQAGRVRVLPDTDVARLLDARTKAGLGPDARKKAG